MDHCTITISLNYFAGGDDYVIKDTLLLFKRGETEQSFSINITDDVLAEPHEVFTLELARPPPTSTVCIARGTPDITLVRVADDDGWFDSKFILRVTFLH